jgi:radical SAM protein with 4Fe4S-binding SPASM domain
MNLKGFDLSSATVKQVVSDEYHDVMYKVFGRRYLEYRQLWSDSISGVARPEFPLHIDFELLNACNYRCSFCPYSTAPNERPKGFNVAGSKALDIRLIEKVLTEADGQLYAVELGYNTEPLLRSDIFDIIRMCKEFGVLDIRMSTNGSLLKQMPAEELINSGLTQLQVSIDATSHETYLVARQSENYEDVVSSLKAFIGIRNKLSSLLPRLKTSYVMTSENSKHASLFKHQWNGIADIIALQDLITYPEAGLEVDSAGLQPYDVNEYPGCYMPKVRLSIRSDGTVHPCCTVPGMTLKVGNIRDRTVSEIWNSYSARSIRDSHCDGSWEKNKICFSCIANTQH